MLEGVTTTLPLGGRWSHSIEMDFCWFKKRDAGAGFGRFGASRKKTMCTRGGDQKQSGPQEMIALARAKFMQS